MYLENPKTAQSGILCCIPQKERCPIGCSDCFFQSHNRSYLYPLEENLPNMPTAEQAKGYVIRVNDGSDSNVSKEDVIEKTACYENRFFNTAIPRLDFPGPVVLTVNPAKMTDIGFHKVDVTPNLMFVRARVNTWNLDLIDKIVKYYEPRRPVVLTFMAYYNDEIPMDHKDSYVFRKRTLNEYWAITTEAWRWVMKQYEDKLGVYSCGKIEGEKGDTHCKGCGNCLREFFSARERMRCQE